MRTTIGLLLLGFAFGNIGGIVAARALFGWRTNRATRAALHDASVDELTAELAVARAEEAGYEATEMPLLLAQDMAMAVQAPDVDRGPALVGSPGRSQAAGQVGALAPAVQAASGAVIPGQVEESYDWAPTERLARWARAPLSVPDPRPVVLSKDPVTRFRSGVDAALRRFDEHMVELMA